MREYTRAQRGHIRFATLDGASHLDFSAARRAIDAIRTGDAPMTRRPGADAVASLARNSLHRFLPSNAGRAGDEHAVERPVARP